MAVPQSFRSAFNGFNREDVVHYLEYLNKKHAAQVEQLHTENDLLQKKLDARPETDSEQTRELNGRIEALTEELNRSREECQTLTDKISELEAEIRQTKQEQAATRHQADQELEAYRRAERTERMARERAEQVYRQTNGVLANATVKVDEAAVQISSISEHVMSQLDLLREAVGSSKQALADAASGLYSLKPRDEE